MAIDHCDPSVSVQSGVPSVEQSGRLEEGTWADVTPIPAPLDLSAFRPARRGVFAAVVHSAATDATPRDWPSAMAAAAGPSRVLIADARGFTGEVLSLRPRGELS